MSFIIKTDGGYMNYSPPKQVLDKLYEVKTITNQSLQTIITIALTEHFKINPPHCNNMGVTYEPTKFRISSD